MTVTASSVDELLGRLVAQFASPYDFLRELVQNAMDAGSDRVEVVLHVHALPDDAAVFELEITDAGSGMDEAILDGELTRLFASGKQGDRTMAGGFGVGFVSVFAWEPQAVLLQTGRGAEAWELSFGADRRFEKHRLDEPVEGTSVRLFRRGRAAEREGIAEAVRDSLWRWCRFCPVELTFEDIAGGRGPERIHDVPLPSDEALVVTQERSDASIRVAFAVPPHVTLLRHGLVLAEGPPAELLPYARTQIEASFDHLRVWADSPGLRTDIGRDHVVDDAGRLAVERTIIAKVHELRGALVERLVALAGTAGPWSASLHREYAYLHEHLRCERDAMGTALDRPAVLRRAGGPATSFAALARAAAYGVVGWCEPDDAAAFESVAIAEPHGVPVVFATAADADARSGWFAEALATFEIELRPVTAIVRRVAPVAGATSFVELLANVLRRSGHAREVALGRFGEDADALWSIAVADDVVVVAPRRLPDDAARRVWLDERHVLLRAALVHLPVQPLVALAGVAFAIAASWPDPSQLEAVRDALDAMRESEVARP